MGTAAFARGAFGDLVGRLQAGLKEQGHYAGAVDEDFGPATERGVRALQAALGCAPSGRADPETWRRATGTSWPGLFERCLALTARIEGHGYSAIAGNFDGAGLTWGIIGFTLQHGGIRELVLDAERDAPGIVRDAFGSAADELLQRLRAQDWPLLEAWTDAISTGRGKAGVAEPWREGFRRLGAAPHVRQLQRERAMRQYFVPAMATAADLALGGDLGVALAFDIHVQNGGVKASDRRAFAARAASGAGGDAGSDARTRRLLLAQLVASSSAARWRADVAARKAAIARGAGVVHGLRLDLADWGLDPVDPA